MTTAAETLAAPAAGTTTAATTTAAAGATGAQPAGGLPTAAASGWWDTIKDPETKTWAANKAYPDAELALKAHRNLEQLMGADKAGRAVMLPKDDADVEGWKNLGSRLGVPDTADGYKLPLPAGQTDDGFAKTAANWFHEAGVPPRAANKIAEAWNGWMGEQLKAAETAERTESATQMAALEKEWGPKFTENKELAQRGYREFAEKFGLNDKAALERAETVLGAGNLTKFFAGIGALNAESKFAGADGKGNGFAAISKDQARAEFDQTTADRAGGKINDFLWRTETEPRRAKLMAIITGQ